MMNAPSVSPQTPVQVAIASNVLDGTAPDALNTETMQATHALDALDAARSALLDWQQGAHSRLTEVQAALAAAQSALDVTRAELVQVKRERDQWRDECTHHSDAVSQLTAKVVGQQNQIEAQNNQIQAQQGHIESQHGELQDKQAEIEAHKAQIEQHKAEIEQHKAQLAHQSDHNRRMHQELLELYRDLRATDLPSLILRVGMNLTGAENSMFVNAAGDQTLAAVGLDDLPETSKQALYEYTRKAAQSEEPVVCNDEQSLPDGPKLINLAAMPVAVQGNLRGVIIVANKRSGPFTDQDTEVLLSIGKHAGMAMENHRLHQALNEAYSSTIAVLADAIEAKDPYTRGHCENVASIAVKVAERLGLQAEEIDQVRYAALLHDIGKIGIPDGILLKPSRLLPEEFQVIQRHSSIGSDLVSRVNSLVPIAPTIKHHHERFDGTGYPDGLSGDAILLASRIVGVVDAFDAMTTPRPYREPVAKEEALAELRRCAGAQFDPTVVEAVAAIVNEAPGL
ncbi:MAG: HD domain-containing protein [Abitibacteriaceae bacterium]|nr:HD domain-containing protein [Abditibacteriaceae bacterium]MBV9864092.1 HD domain-containing protein [Abditibacteriaceae bacterium]